jgi:hypothetical protein
MTITNLPTWVTVWMDIGRKASWDKGNEMIMNTMGGMDSMGSGKNHFMFRENGWEVLRYRGCLSCLYGMELGNNARMTFFHEHRLHAMGTNDLQGTNNDDLELILLALLVELQD